MKQVKNYLLAFFYQKMMDNCHRLVGEDFLHEDALSKSDTQFSLYVELLDLYAELLRGMRKHGNDFYASLQERRIEKIVRLANTTTWWKEYFRKNNVHPENIKSVRDLNLIPPISRPDLIDVPDADLLVKTTKCKYTFLRQTSGSTTGTPMRWLMDERFAFMNIPASYFVKIFRDFGFPFHEYSDRKFLIRFNFLRRTPMEQFITEIILSNGNKNVDARVREIADQLEHLGGCVIDTSPSELFFFVQKLKEADLHPPILLVILIGQKIELEEYAFMKEYLKCPIVTAYGSREVSPSAIGCKDKLGFYHVIAERFFYQIVDDKGNEVADGEFGNITITCLDNFLMPLIRYQPGDIGRLYTHPTCSCDNPTPLLEIGGKKTDIIELSSGEAMPAQKIFRLLVNPLFFSSVRRCQVRQERLDNITILLEIRKMADSKRDILKKLKELVERAYRGKLKVLVKEVDTIDTGEGIFSRFVPLQKINSSTKP